MQIYVIMSLFLYVEADVFAVRLKHWKLFFLYLLMLTINLVKQS